MLRTRKKPKTHALVPGSYALEKSWPSAVQFVRARGFLDVPALAAVAVAQARSGQHHALGDDMACSAMRRVQANLALSFPNFGGASGVALGPLTRELVQNVLAAGGTIAGGAVARAACCLEELEHTWDVSDLDIYAEQGDSVESIVGAIDRFTSSLGKGWKAVHERAPPNAPRYESNSEVLRVRKIRITKACPREARPPAGMTTIDIIETRAHGARAVQYFDINVCRVALVQGSLLFVGGPTRYNGVEDPPNVTRGAPLGPLAAVNGGTPLTLRATATALGTSASSADEYLNFASRVAKYARRGFVPGPDLATQLLWFEPVRAPDRFCVVIDTVAAGLCSNTGVVAALAAEFEGTRNFDAYVKEHPRDLFALEHFARVLSFAQETATSKLGDWAEPIHSDSRAPPAAPAAAGHTHFANRTGVVAVLVEHWGGPVGGARLRKAACAEQSRIQSAVDEHVRALAAIRNTSPTANAIYHRDWVNGLTRPPGRAGWAANPWDCNRFRNVGWGPLAPAIPPMQIFWCAIRCAMSKLQGRPHGMHGGWVPGVWAWRDTTSTHRSLSCALLGDVTCRPPVQTREEGGIQRVSAKAGLSNPLHPLFFPQDRAHARRAPPERRWTDVKGTAWERGMRAATGVLEDYDDFHCAQESSDSDDV